MCQWTGRKAAQTVEGCTYSAQPSVTMDRGPLSGVTGIPLALKEDIACTSAQLVYGTTLRSPEFFLQLAPQTSRMQHPMLQS